MIRPVTEADGHRMFMWRNSADAVEASASQREVSWADHVVWLKDLLSQEPIRCWVIETDDDDLPVGYVRLARAAGVVPSHIPECIAVRDWFEISIFVDAAHRQIGIGGTAVMKAVHTLKAHGWEAVIARIRRDNVASIRMFEACRFVATLGGDDKVGEWTRWNTSAL